MSLETAAQQDAPPVIGDLHTSPKPERRLHNQDTYAIEWILPHCGSERLFFIQVLRDTQALLEAELLRANPDLDAYLIDKMGSRQFRSRPDLAHGKLAVEQWVPALDCWMVNGYFDFDKPWAYIVQTLQAGDPTKRSAQDELAHRREEAAKVQAQNDQAGTDRVLAAVDSMTDSQVKQFVEVEQALHTGDPIHARGQDGHTLDLLVSDTRKAAALGDAEAQSVLSRGQRDNPTCILPSTNPLRHRHRSERVTKER